MVATGILAVPAIGDQFCHGIVSESAKAGPGDDDAPGMVEAVTATIVETCDDVAFGHFSGSGERLGNSPAAQAARRGAATQR